jgi:carboxymethylenebutenolidase
MPATMSRNLACSVLLCVSVAAADDGLLHRTMSFRSSDTRIAMDEYAAAAAAHAQSAVVLLYGSGGLRSSAFPYATYARIFVANDRLVYLPHFLDVTHGSAAQPQLHYAIWARAVRDALSAIHSRTALPLNRTFLVGYSLGASVALSVGAREPDLAGLVVWSGSLPDLYADVRRLPPLLILHGARDAVIPESNARQLAQLCALRQFSCQLTIFPGEGHAFSKSAITIVNLAPVSGSPTALDTS